MFLGQAVEHGLRQAARFRAHQEGIAPPVTRRIVARAAARAQREDTGVADSHQRVLERRVCPDARKLAVVEARPPEPRLVQLEAQRLHEMQGHPRVRAKTNDVAGIGRNFRLVQDQAEHIV